MGIIINGIDKLDTDDFDQIVITEENVNDFMVKVVGRGKGIKNNFSKGLERLSLDEKVIVVIKKYLDTFKINGVTKLLPVTKFNNKWALVYGENSKKELRMQIFNPKFRFISSMIMDKYLNDRYNILFNTDFNYLEINDDDNLSRYEIVDDKVKLTLMSNDNILVSEREFLQELLYYKFSQISEMANITEIYNNDKNKSNNIPVGYVVTCGNMQITFPKSYKSSLILQIIRNYNEEFKYKKRLKK